MILPKKQDIIKAKADERKKEIDDGMALASRIDKLRETKANEERQLELWRKTSLNTIQTEINQFIEVRDNLKVQTEEAEKHRKKLLEPLDNEWKEVNLEKSRVREITENACTLMKTCKDKERMLEQDREKLSQLIIKAKDNEKETEKAKSQSISLKELAQKTYEVAREEHETQTQLHEKKLSSLSSQEKEYEIGIRTNEIKEKALEEKEVELIIREKELTRRTKNLQRVENIKNDSSTANN